MERPQFAYTTPTPDAGQVGFVNIQQTEDGLGFRFTVRSEGETANPVACVVPLGAALKMMADALESVGLTVS